MVTKLKQISIEGEKFYFTFSFDINDLIGDGIWWLQVYNSHKDIIFDRPFASSLDKLDIKQVQQMIKEDFLIYKGAIL